jgi:hypothetical protein
MTSKGLGEMVEGDSADTCFGKFPLVSMAGRAEGLACADTGARTPIIDSGNWAKRSACASGANLGRPLFLVFFFSFLLVFVTARPQHQPKSTSTRVGVDKAVSWTTTPVKLLGHFQTTQEADFQYGTLF